MSDRFCKVCGQITAIYTRDRGCTKVKFINALDAVGENSGKRNMMQPTLIIDAIHVAAKQFKMGSKKLKTAEEREIFCTLNYDNA